MDYESDSSDFHFPEDTGLAKLSSPLNFKVPESRDWALDEFMQTLSEKPHMETDNLMSFKQYIPVSNNEEEDFYTTGPPKLTLPTYEEKDFLQQISQHFIDLERKELHNILKGGFNLVQNDIQTNTNSHHHTSPFATSAHPDISWFDEAFDYGHHQRNASTGISNLENIDFKRSPNRYSPFDQQQQVYNHSMLMASSIILSEDEEEDKDEEMMPSVVMSIKEITAPVARKEVKKIIIPATREPVSLSQPIEYHKPLPTLPLTTTTQPEIINKKKGLKYKLKSQLSKTFLKSKESKSTLATTITEKTTKTTPLFLQKSKQFIRKMFPIHSSNKQ